MTIRRCAKTLLIGHVLGAYAVAVCTLPNMQWIIGGALFAALGSFFLLIEVPVMIVGVSCYRIFDSLTGKVMLSVVMLAVSTMLFRGLIGEQALPGFRKGYTLAGAILGLCIVVEGFRGIALPNGVLREDASAGKK